MFVWEIRTKLKNLKEQSQNTSDIAKCVSIAKTLRSLKEVILSLIDNLYYFFFFFTCFFFFFIIIYFNRFFFVIYYFNFNYFFIFIN